MLVFKNWKNESTFIINVYTSDRGADAIQRLEQLCRINNTV